MRRSLSSSSWTQPDFSELARSQPALRPYLRAAANKLEKPSLAFEDPRASKALNEAILHRDFGLLVELPITNLIPTVPQKLNYIHLIETVLQKHFPDVKEDSIVGVDIGCGASCIYPLLSCALHPTWRFLATDIDAKSLEQAKLNVRANSLDKQIQLLLSPSSDAIFIDVLPSQAAAAESIATFTMCNPPFFELDYKPENRSGHRPPPPTQVTATDSEKMTEGGERAFVERQIVESLQLKTKIKLFTTMLGCKRNLAPLKKKLRELNCPFVSDHPLVQGATHRWVLCWSFTASPLPCSSQERTQATAASDSNLARKDAAKLWLKRSKAKEHLGKTFASHYLRGLVPNMRTEKMRVKNSICAFRCFVHEQQAAAAQADIAVRTASSGDYGIRLSLHAGSQETFQGVVAALKLRLQD